MPAPIVNPTSIEKQIAEAREVELQNKAFRALSAYNLLFSYDWNGTGPMPNPIEWTAPSGEPFRFEAGSGELQYNGTPYSSLGPTQKRNFFQYLPKFIKFCLDVYDETYNL
jgi:hypothetical protein